MSTPPESDAFGAFVKKKSSHVKLPEGFRARLKLALDQTSPALAREEHGSALYALLDRQLGADQAQALEARAQDDAALARELESERRFLALVKRASSRVESPAGLSERLREKLGGAQASAGVIAGQPAQASSQAGVSKNWATFALSWGSLAAAVLLLAAVWLFRGGDCPYLLACSKEHQLVMNGQEPLALISREPQEIAQFVNTKAAMQMACIPNLAGFNLKPLGAGLATFAHAPAAWNAPQGVFVRYSGAHDESATLIFHNWPAETPGAQNRRVRDGVEYWAADHDGYRVVCFKCPCSGVLCTLVTKNWDLEESVGMAMSAHKQVVSLF